MKDYERNLHRFSDMDDVEVAEDDPDVRGWDVVSSDGHDIGEVKDLLVDTTSMKVRCLEVELDGSHFSWNDNRRVAIPVDNVLLDEEHDDVVIQGLGLDEIGRLEEYRPVSGEYLGPARDTVIQGSDTSDRDLRGQTAGTSRDAGFSDRDRLTRSEEEVNIGKREVQTGEVRVSKHVEAEHVSQPVTRERERVHIERRPITGDIRGSEARFENDEIRVPVTEEQVVVEKRPVVKEELVISKERVQDTENVETDVRKERFDVQKDGRVLDEGDETRRGRR